MVQEHCQEGAGGYLLYNRPKPKVNKPVIIRKPVLIKKSPNKPLFDDDIKMALKVLKDSVDTLHSLNETLNNHHDQIDKNNPGLFDDIRTLLE